MLAQANLSRLDDPAELALMRKLALYPRLVEAAARPMSRTGSPSIFMNWLANFTRNRRAGTMRLIYASLSKMIQK